MKRKVTVTDPNGKKISGTVVLRDQDHFEAQKKFRGAIFKPKKGKGSFKRNKKIEGDE